MATIGTCDDYPDIAMVTGSEVYTDEKSYRGDLMRFLHRQDQGPVRKGTHDFWITYPVPAYLGAPNFSEAYVDHDARPRPLRGIIQMGSVPSVSTGVVGDDENLSGEISTLLQEVGHYWNVRGGIQLEHDGDTVGFDQNPVARINEGRQFDGLPLLGRTANHWSAYFDADASPFDGQTYERKATSGNAARWDHVVRQRRLRSARGAYPEYPLRKFFNDLDLHAMGVLGKRDLYPGRGGKLRWLHPLLASPLEYQVGIFVQFSATERLFFGFDQDHRTISVRRTGAALVTLEVPGYDRFDGDRRRVALRIRRDGDQYHCEARLDAETGHPRELFEPAAVPAGGARVARPSGGARVAGRPRSGGARVADDYRSFRAVGPPITITGRPRLVGLVVERNGDSFFVEGDFTKVALRTAGEVHHYPLTSVPDRHQRIGAGEVADGRPALHVPVDGPVARTEGGRFYLGTPFSKSSAGLQPAMEDFYPRPDGASAPRVVLKAPTGDFAFAASVQVNRAIVTPWYGGGVKDKQLWGIEQTADARTVRLPGDLTERRGAPAGDTFKIAFIAVADRRSRINDRLLQDLDNVRKAWDAGFRIATRSNRRSNSSLS